jgi:hypothetical protein
MANRDKRKESKGKKPVPKKIGDLLTFCQTSYILINTEDTHSKQS